MTCPVVIGMICKDNAIIALIIATLNCDVLVYLGPARDRALAPSHQDIFLFRWSLRDLRDERKLRNADPLNFNMVSEPRFGSIFEVYNLGRMLIGKL